MDSSGPFGVHFAAQDGQADMIPSLFSLDLKAPDRAHMHLEHQSSRSVSPELELGDFEGILMDDSAPVIDFGRNSDHEPTLAALNEKDRESPIVDEELQRIFQQQLSSSLGSVSSVSTDCSVGHLPAERSISKSSLPSTNVTPDSENTATHAEYSASPSVAMSPTTREEAKERFFEFPILAQRQHWRQTAAIQQQSVQTLMDATSKPPQQSPSSLHADPTVRSVSLPRAFASDELAKSVAALAKLSTTYPPRSAAKSLIFERVSTLPRSFPDSPANMVTQEGLGLGGGLESGRSEAQMFPWQNKHSHQSRGQQALEKTSPLSGDADGGGSTTDDLLDDSSDESESELSPVLPATGRRRRHRRSFTTDPSPARLLSIDEGITRINNAVSIGVGDEASRREKNKLASRVCRLKKKYHFEAVKVLQRGLEMEAAQLRNLTMKIREEILCGGGALFAKAKSLEESIWTHRVSGRSDAFIADVLSETRRGNWNGGLTGRILPK